MGQGWGRWRREMMDGKSLPARINLTVVPDLLHEPSSFLLLFKTFVYLLGCLES